MNLRLNEGFSLARWGQHETRMCEAMQVLQAKGLAEQIPHSQRWRASTRGMQILDTTIQMAYALIDFKAIQQTKSPYQDPTFA